MSTVHFLADLLDQLDLALDQVAANDRNYDRFAMMLLDNVVELLLHRQPTLGNEILSNVVDGDLRSVSF